MDVGDTIIVSNEHKFLSGRTGVITSSDLFNTYWIKLDEPFLEWDNPIYEFRVPGNKLILVCYVPSIELDTKIYEHKGVV